MEKYGVLIVDDSAVMRKTLSSIIESSQYFYVIGKARNGLDALEKMERLAPDLVIMDAVMPELDGIGFMHHAKRNHRIPIVMLADDLESKEDALLLGAYEYQLKSVFIKRNAEMLKNLYRMLENVCLNKASSSIAKHAIVQPTVSTNIVKGEAGGKILIIGSSTGGPAALQKIILKIPKSLSIPIVIIQHMPLGFTKSLAERFNNVCEVKVKEAEHQEILKPGTVYIAPAGVQTLVKLNKEGYYYFGQRSETTYSTLYKPSIDVTLLSIAEIVKEQLVTVILTGMGDDGLRGCYSVKDHGGLVFAEAEESCVVYGMPKVVSQAGLVDKELPIDDLADEILLHI